MNGLKNRGKFPSIPSSARRIYRDNFPSRYLCFALNPFGEVYSRLYHMRMVEAQLSIAVAGLFVFRYSNDECSKEKSVKKFFRNFSGGLIFALSRDLPLEGQKPLTCSLKTEYTFNRYIPDRGGESPSRMKVRHELPARKGYHGKQG